MERASFCLGAVAETSALCAGLPVTVCLNFSLDRSSSFSLHFSHV